MWMTFYPRQYGAIGDGVTDDTTAVQACFDAAAGGGTVFLDGTFLCTDDIDVQTGSGSVVNVLGRSWAAGGLIFSGASVTKGLNFSGSGAAGTYAYCGSVEELQITCQSSATRGLTFYNVNHPRAKRVRINGAAGAAVKFDYTLMGKLEHCLITSCGSSTEGSVEVDNSTTFMWDHSRISGGNTTVGGLLIDRTLNITIIGGAIESAGIQIRLASKAESSVGVIGGVIAGIDLENPGTHYIEIGYGWSGTANNAARTLTFKSVTGALSGATDVRYGVKMENTTDMHFDNCHFALTGASQTASFYLEGTGNIATWISKTRRSYGSTTAPWVVNNGTQLTSATPYSEFFLDEPKTVNAPPSTLNPAGATPSIAISSQGGFYRFIKLTQSGATNLTRFVFNGNGSGVEIFVQCTDANTTFKQATGSTQGMLKLLTGADTAAVQDKMYHFFCDGVFWHQLT
jgi:hypothetical protein